jgi:hypothetical protein
MKSFYVIHNNSKLRISMYTEFIHMHISGIYMTR